MNFKKILFTLSFLFSTIIVFGQGFSYTFTDPCTFKTKEIFINNPSGNVALIYNGQIQSFTQSQLLSGELEQWINQVNSSNPGGPCSGVGLYQNTTINAIVTQNNIAVLTNVLSALNDISSMGGSNIGGIIEAKEKSNSEDSKKKPNQGQNVLGGSQSGNNNTQGQPTSVTNGQTTPNSGASTINNQTQSNGTTNNNGGSTTTSGGNQTNSQPQTGNGNNQNSGGSNSSQGATTPTTGGNTTNTSNPTQGGGQTTQPPVTNPPSNSSNQGSGSVTQSGTNGGQGGVPNNGSNESQKSNEDKLGEMNKTSATNSTQVKSKVANAKQGGILLTGDIVVINSASGDDPQQFKINMSLTKSNTDNTFVKGALLNFTSSINNSNITFFAGYRKKNLTSIIANSSMLNFDKDYFNTTSIMESYKYKKYTATLGVNYTTGNLGRSKFQSLSALGGFIGTFKVSPKINNTTMFVMVYSPFVYYYEGIWYKSGLLAVPFTAFDYRISQKFKLNLSFSGVQQVKDATLNYQVLLGAKALL